MKILLFALALLSAAQLAAQEAPPAIDLEQRMLLRCAATFALVADRQQRGEDWALEYPPMARAGREFFVRASALVMDETGMDREAVAALLREQAQEIWGAGTIAELMPVCLPMIVGGSGD